MGRITIGSRVRVKNHPYILFAGQDTGTVLGYAAEVGGRGDWAVKLDNYDAEISDTLSFEEDELELLANGFEPGDRVRIVKEPLSTTGAIGLEATVEEVEGWFPWPLLLRFDDEDAGRYATLSAETALTRACFEDVELVASSEENTADDVPCIVCLLEDGWPKPSEPPVIYVNRSRAARDAQRKAELNPGQVFAVFEFCESREVLPQYEHEWQRLAAAGEIYAAVVLLRDTAGISFVNARNAVAHWTEQVAS